GGRQRIYGGGSRIERKGRDREPDVGPHSVAWARPDRTSGDTRWRQASGRRGGRRPPRSAGKNGRVRDVYSAAADRRLFRHGTGGANDAAAGGIRFGNSSGAPAAGSKSADSRSPKPAGFGG